MALLSPETVCMRMTRSELQRWTNRLQKSDIFNSHFFTCQQAVHKSTGLHRWHCRNTRNCSGLTLEIPWPSLQRSSFSWCCNISTFSMEVHKRTQGVGMSPADLLPKTTRHHATQARTPGGRNPWSNGNPTGKGIKYLGRKSLALFANVFKLGLRMFFLRGHFVAKIHAHKWTFFSVFCPRTSIEKILRLTKSFIIHFRVLNSQLLE